MNHPEWDDPEGDITTYLENVTSGSTIPPSPSETSVPSPAKVAAYSPSDKISETTTEFSDEEGFSPERQKDIYNIAQAENEVNPWSRGFIGIPANYLSVGFMIGGSTSILYPLLVVNEGATSSLVTASHAIVTIFWSYKFVFGLLSDCFPVCGWKRKPYIVMGWVLCAGFLADLASIGDNISSRRLVLMLTLANFGYVMADVAADGFMVWIAHREPISQRGRMQTLIYASNKMGQILVNLIILFGFSGPHMNCPGYEPDPEVSCTTNEAVVGRNDLSSEYPEDWCHRRCHNATFDFEITIPQFYRIILVVILLSLPLYFILREDKIPREHVGKFLLTFWNQLKRRAAWQVMLYSMISHITFGVINAAKINANFVWLDLHTTQYQIMILMEKTVIFVGLNIVRTYALNASWRQMVLLGSMVVTIFNCMYFLIVFDVLRSSWFYIFTDVSQHFMHTLNFLASLFCMVEVAEPGYEAITYSLITTASNVVSPLSSVISYQILAFFPDLHRQESIATDTPSVRMQFATLHALTIVINLTSLLSLPLLPRQKREARELVARGETSTFWGWFAMMSALVFLAYSTVVTFLTVASHDVYGCFKILGGSGCSAEESSVPAYLLVALVFVYCYGVNFYHSFWPVLRGRARGSLSMFL